MIRYQGSDMIVIGEKINGTRKSVKEAIAKRDESFIQELALRQVEAGAQYIDVNAGTSPEKIAKHLLHTIQRMLAGIE